MSSQLSLESDLIAGLATPPGRAGVAVIRLSGPNLPQHILPLFRHPQQKHLTSASFTPRHMHRINIIDTDGKTIIDQSLVVFFPAPHSFTGESQIEIHCHGSPVVISQIFAILTTLQVRMAKPGEFSRRAFLHGKMDLTQAEALMALIHASTLQAAREANRQLQGSLKSSIESLRERLLDVLAQVEAELDFSDEEIDPDNENQLLEKVIRVRTDLEQLLKGAAWGERLQNGFELVMAGLPNVGKSSLFNLLIGRDKAIVTEIPGTTRDLNEHHIEIQGIPVLLVDTAGIRTTEAVVEQEGIRRAKQRIQQADGVLLVYDARVGLSENELQLIHEIENDRLILVANKIDLCQTAKNPRIDPPLKNVHSQYLSCLHQQGLESLLNTIHEMFASREGGNEGAIIMVSRQREAVHNSLKSVVEAVDLMKNAAPNEILAMVLRTALQDLAEIAGEFHHEQLLDRIFSTFCIGK